MMAVTRRRLLVRILLLVVLVLVAGWAVWDYAEAKRLERATAAILAAHEPLTTAEMTPPDAVRQSREAARLYTAAAALVTLPDEPRALMQTRQVLEDAMASEREADAGLEKALARADEIVQRNSMTLDLIDRAAPLEFAGFEPGTGYNYRTAHLSEVMRIAEIRWRLLVLRHEADRAVSALRSYLRFVRVFGTSSSLIAALYQGEGMLAAVADAAPMHASAESLVALQSSLAELDDERQFLRIVLRERAVFLEYWWPRLVSDPRPSSGAQPITDSGGADFFGSPVAKFLARPLARRALAESLAEYAKLVRLARSGDLNATLHALRDLVERARQDNRQAGSWGRSILFTRAMLEPDPAVYARIAQASAVGLTTARSARVAIAVELFRRAVHRLPASLDELAARGGALPRDPITNGPFKYAVRDGEVLVYGVGENGIDDGGDIDRPGPEPPTGIRPWPRDWGVRVRIGR